MRLSRSWPARTRPCVLLIGGPDVSSRIRFAKGLSGRADFCFAGSGNDQRSAIEGAGFEYHSYDLARTINPISDIRAMIALRRIIKSIGPNIVHTFDTKPNLLGRLAARAAGTPMIVGTVAGLGMLAETHQQHPFVRRAMYCAIRLTTRLSQYTTFQTEDDLRFYLEHRLVRPSGALIVPGSGVDTMTFDRRRYSVADRDEQRSSLGLSENDVVVTMVSRLIRAKGVILYARTARLLQAAEPTIRFILVGANDSGARDCLDAAELDDIRESVLWLGQRDDIAQLLLASDIFVLPTLYGEGIPRSILEAASMGLPIVASSIAGCRAALDAGRCGLVLETLTPASLAESILSLALDADRRGGLGERARSFVSTNFSEEIVFQKLWALYSTLDSKTAPMNGGGNV